MKKIFFAICFIGYALSFASAKADVLTVEQAAEQNVEPKPIDNTLEGMPDPNDLKAVQAFFKERLKTVNVSKASELGDLNKSNAMDIQHSAEYIQALEQQNKSVFEKIYDEALKRLDQKQEEGFSPDTIFYEEVKQNMQNMASPLPDVAVVSVTLPNGKKVLAPAKEHIPYLLVSYQILPTGMVEVDEEVVVIANGEKLKNGLIKTMPSTTTSRTHVTKKLEVMLQSVSINGHEVPHKLRQVGDNIVFVPKQNYVLESGVYTYRFKYFLDRKLWYYDAFTEFYTNLTGSYPFVTTSANAIVSVPDGKTFLSSVVLSGFASDLSPDRTVMAKLSDNALGFASVLPLAQGEGMHVLVSLDKDVFLKPDISQRFVWFISDYGDILFALLGFLAIFASYQLSWHYLKNHPMKAKRRASQNAALNRYIVSETYDKRSFVAALLDLCRLRVLDIVSAEGVVSLIKKTDNLKGVSGGYKKMLFALFGKQNTTVDIDVKNALKFSRADKILQKNVKKAYALSTYLLNLGYIMFSFGMLFLSLFAISYLAINPVEIWLILLTSVLTMLFYMWIFEYRYQSRVKKYIFRIISGAFVCFNVILLSVYIHFWAACLIAAMSYTILIYTRLFSNKKGLMKYKIMSLEKTRQYLKDNALQVSTGIDFENRQAAIFAFELEKLYPKNSRNQNIYRLDVAKQMTDML